MEKRFNAEMTQIFKAIISILIVLAVGACAPTRLTSVWRDDAYTVGNVKAILIKGIASNQRDSRILEEAFIRKLTQTGVHADTGTHSASDDNLKESPETRSELIAEARQKQADALLIIRLAGIIKKKIYHPPRPYFMSPSFCDLRYRPYCCAAPFWYEPGYYTEHPFFQIESNLYDVQTSQLIWSAASETFDPGSINALAESASGTIIENLHASRLLLK